MVLYEPDFASRQAAAKAKQLLGREAVTPKGRTVMLHAADRMANPPKGRVVMTLEEVDQVLDTGTKIKKYKPQGEGTVTIQHPGMEGSPEVAVDALTGTRVITAIKNKPKPTKGATQPASKQPSSTQAKND